MSRNVYVVRFSRRSRGVRRGQSLVEFAIVSIVLLLLILGILEMGRLLFVYSVVSNAAHEGVRYGIIRPQDLYAAYEMQTRVARGTAVATIVVVPNGNCNVVDKAREKVWLVPKNDLIVNVWFDNGNGTPTVLPSNLTDITDLVPYTGPQNRIAVETKYRYQFIVPFVSMFAPNGFDIRMRAARTIENFEFDTRPCSMSWTPAPTPPPRPTSTNTPTQTPINTRTPTKTPTAAPPTNTATNTRTNTPTITATPSRTNTAVPPTNTPTNTRTNTPGPTSTRTNTPVPPTITLTSTRTNTPGPPTATPTRTQTPTITRTPTRTSTPVPPTATPTTGITLPTPPPTGAVPIPVP